MRLKRKLYFLGFAIFIFSFFLPALTVFGEPIRGYKSALMLFGSLFKFNDFLNYSFIIFANLANIFTILVFVLQFKISFKKLIIFQFIAFLSAFFWVGYGIVQEKNLSDLLIGYWNWLFGIFFMLISMFASIKEQKILKQRSEQELARQHQKPGEFRSKWGTAVRVLLRIIRLMEKLIKALHIIGYSWIAVVGIYIIFNYIRVLLTDGLPFDERVLSFLNLWNIFFSFIALMPGLICILISDYFYKKNKGIGWSSKKSFENRGAKTTPV